MVKKKTTLERRDYLRIGRRVGSDDVAKEARLAIGRWRRDVAGLTEYGFGPTALGSFEALVGEHDHLRASRGEAVVAKLGGTAEARDVVEEATFWVEWATTVLGTLARSDERVARELASAAPTSSTDLHRSTSLLLELLLTHATRFESDLTARLARGETLRDRLHEVTQGRGATANAPQVDTAELDVLDGRLYVAVVDLNAAARKAIRHGALAAAPSDYRLHVLKKPRASAAKPETPST